MQSIILSLSVLILVLCLSYSTAMTKTEYMKHVRPGTVVSRSNPGNEGMVTGMIWIKPGYWPFTKSKFYIRREGKWYPEQGIEL